VDSRLFTLLPPLMPVQAKYKLTESLWQHFGPSSRKTLMVGLNANIGEVIGRIREHIDDIVVRYKIQEELQRRFEWLSAGDVNVKQELLNHLRKMEKTIVVEGARAQLPVMLEHLRNNGTHTHRLAQLLKVGKHELEVLADKHANGVTLAEPVPVGVGSATSGGNGLIWLLVIGALLLALAFAR
jgi:hypothetical protein